MSLRGSVRGARGYSLIEVVVAIFILGAAILPMASMFDSALNASRSGGDYDEARALANETLEGVRALDYERAATLHGVQTPPGCARGKFECEVKTEFVGEDLEPDSASKSRMLVEVEVQWDGGKSYRASALVAAGRP